MIRVTPPLIALALLTCHSPLLHATEQVDAGTSWRFGRLFLDPDQRGKPTTSRARALQRNAPDEASQQDAIPAGFHLNGIALDEHGHMTVWVNGVQQLPGGNTRMSALPTPGRVRVTMGDAAIPIDLGVGQRLDPEGQRVIEGFEGRAPTVGADSRPVALPTPEPRHANGKRSTARVPALHLHVHTARPGARRRASKGGDN